MGLFEVGSEDPFIVEDGFCDSTVLDANEACVVQAEAAVSRPELRGAGVDGEGKGMVVECKAAGLGADKAGEPVKAGVDEEDELAPEEVRHKEGHGPVEKEDREDEEEEEAAAPIDDEEDDDATAGDEKVGKDDRQAAGT